MIVQCEACQTRFRLADEKVKPGGIKVRCSKCKEIFTVVPPPPEPAAETVEFDSFNMEKITEDAPGAVAPPEAGSETETAEADKQATEYPNEPESQTKSGDQDFRVLEGEMAGHAGPGEEPADEFSIASSKQTTADDTSSMDRGFSFDEQPQPVSTSAEPPDFDGTFSETDEPGGPPAEFDFSEEAGSAESPEAGLEEQESSGISEFSFSDDEETAEQELPGGFDFSDEADEGGSFTFDDAEADSTSTAAEEYAVPGEFSFDEEEPFGEGAAAWSDTTTAEEGSFDFDEPRFDTEGSQTGETASTAGGELQFGEIDFASNSDQSAETSLQGGDDFSKSTLAKQEEPEPFSQRQQSPPPPSRHYDDEGPPLSAPPTPKKSSLSRILVLLVLLLIVLGGAAGYLFMQEGSLNLNTVAQYLPFLQDYIGETPVASPGDRIGINISGSSYVNGQSGQMLVIQGAAVNNHPSTRSAITIKGILLDAKGKALLQQTVFCGNKLDETTLKSMPFAAIEEAMNNQFGDSLSNMNVAAGASIPFTIVFRNLPAGIANINVEVVDSKPGAG